MSTVDLQCSISYDENEKKSQKTIIGMNSNKSERQNFRKVKVTKPPAFFYNHRLST